MGNPNKTGIYGIFCRDTDECLYVGQSGDIPRRWKQHLKLLVSQKHPRKDFGEWYAERGADESLLSFVVLEEGVDADSLNLRETHWFHKLSPRFFGKQPSLNEKWRHSEATKKKISESMKRRTVEKLLPLRSEIVRMASDKSLSLEDMSKEFSINQSSIKGFMEDENIEYIFQEERKIYDHEKLLHMYFEEKLSTRKIAEYFGCTQPNVIYTLNKYKGKDKRFLKVEERRHLRFSGKPKVRLASDKGRFEKVRCYACGNLFGSNVIKRHTDKCKNNKGV